jgi:S-adenosylmethionine:diacylglycerol 3-amino-3-carboxypropyl transferase
MPAACDIVNESITALLAARPAGSVDAFVLLDAQDWMTDSQLSELWAEITRTATPGARVIYRTAAAASPLPGTGSRWHPRQVGLPGRAQAWSLARGTARRSMAAFIST